MKMTNLKKWREHSPYEWQEWAKEWLEIQEKIKANEKVVNEKIDTGLRPLEKSEK